MPAQVPSTEKVRHIIGLMSGTSCDGIDAAAVEISGSGSTLRARLEAFHYVAYEPELREKFLQAQDATLPALALLNVELGELLAAVIEQLMAKLGQPREYFDAVASHGHTVAHEPEKGVTVQLGEAAIIAERTGLTVVSDFRAADVAAGGQGAPLIPYVDWCLLRDESTHRIVQNIGGIANCTVLTAGCELAHVRAWDTGPGNMIIDECVRVLTGGAQQFDENGAIAAEGRTDDNWLRDLMRHEYFFRPPPVSCGREQFGKFYTEQFVGEARRRGLSTPDIIATATSFTAESIAHSYRMHAAPLLYSENLEIILGGGGAFNPTLRRMLQARLVPHRVLTHEDIGIRSDAREAMAFAILAHETLGGVPANVPSATGARHAAVLGKISRGASDTTPASDGE